MACKRCSLSGDFSSLFSLLFTSLTRSPEHGQHSLSHSRLVTDRATYYSTVLPRKAPFYGAHSSPSPLRPLLPSHADICHLPTPLLLRSLSFRSHSRSLPTLSLRQRMSEKTSDPTTDDDIRRMPWHLAGRCRRGARAAATSEPLFQQKVR